MVKIIEIQHIYDPTADFRRKRRNLLMHLQWHISLVTATCSYEQS